MTQSGFYGKFVELDGEVVVLENEDGVESYWSQTAIAMLKNPPFTETTEENITEEIITKTVEQGKVEEQLEDSKSSLEREENK